MPSVHHFAVRARDFDASVRFYTEGLGFGEPYFWDHKPLVNRAAFIPAGDGTWMEIFDGGEESPPPGPDDAPQGLFHVAVAYEDVQAAFDKAVGAGGIPLEEPVTRTLHGDPEIEATMAFVMGPDGEVVELYRNDHLVGDSVRRP